MASITNQATITYNTQGSSAQNQTASNIISTEVISTLNLTKTPLTTSYTPGETVSYSVYMTNNSNFALTNLTFTDDMGGSSLPLSYISQSVLGYVNGILTDVTVSDNTVFSISDTIPAGATVILVYSMRTSATATQFVTNTITVSAKANNATLSENASATITALPYSSVNVYKQADKTSVMQGGELTYTLTLQNTGNADATNIVVTDKLPDNFTVGAVSVTQQNTTVNYTSSDYTIDAQTNTITLPSGSTKTISVLAATSAGPGLTTITISGNIS